MVEMVRKPGQRLQKEEGICRYGHHGWLKQQWQRDKNGRRYLTTVCTECRRLQAKAYYKRLKASGRKKNRRDHSTA